MAELREQLARLSIGEVIPEDARVLEVVLPAELEEALQVLIDNNILSAPVWDPAAGHYLGFLDTRDLVSFAVNLLHQPQKKPKGSRYSMREMLSAPARFDAKLKHMKPAASPTLTVSYMCRRHPFRPLSMGDNLLKAGERLASGDHRVAVLNGSGKCCGMLSQSLLCRFVGTMDWGLAANTTLREFGFCEKEVVCMSAEEPALTAFELIDSRAISGVAVLDARGSLVAATSGKDLALFLNDQAVDLLHLSIAEYLALHELPAPLVKARFDETLLVVVQRIAAASEDGQVCHRAFVVDDDERPVSVVSLKDALAAILKA